MKTQLSKPAGSKASYTKEYKQEALELWRASGRSAARVAAELGIRPPLLYRRVRTEREPNASKSGAKPVCPLEELEAENRRLRTENAKLLEQRPDFKKVSRHPLRSAAQRYARIEAMSGQYKVAWLCEARLVSRSGYYDWKERRRHLVRARRRSQYRAKTTDSRPGGPIAPNRLQNLTLRRPDQLWVSDATGVLTGQGWLSLVALLDVFTRRVIGWAMSPILDAPLVIAALRMALGQRRPARSLILHSDRGSQFASAAYRQVLAQPGLVASISRPGNCYDNAFIESFWSTLKYELVYHHRFTTRAEARTAIFDYIETFYNRTRLHSSLDYLSPIRFEIPIKLNYPCLTVRENNASPDQTNCR